MKKSLGKITAIPSKRVFLSIIADYNLERSMCELIDNALDIWAKNGKQSKIKVDVELNKDQQTIKVDDNAGGVKESELEFMVSPGKTQRVQTDETIGIFGVGTKRAVVALAQDIKITTRHHNEKTLLIEFDDRWLADDDWYLDKYEVDDIDIGTTIIELQKLRFNINDNSITNLKEYLESTYAKFIKDDKVDIILNSEKLKPKTYENWAYPPNFSPRRYFGELKTEDDSIVKVEVYAGLSKESSPAVGDYGVFIYCNDRLIVRGLKNYDVGFTKGLAGQPHPSISLLKVFVNLNGEARFMPWNSSKSGIMPNHHVFVALRTWLVQVVKEFASLSRRWQGHWPEKVFKYTSGEIVDVEIKNFPAAKKSYLPDLPKTRKGYSVKIEQKNKSIVKEKPWAKGLYEGIIAVDTIFKKSALEQKNRICLILLDSNLEIAFKEFLVNDSGTRYSDTRLLSLFKNRVQVHEEIKKYKRIRKEIWKKIEHYYLLRCELIHKRSTVDIRDDQIEDFREIVQLVLKKLFKLELDSD